MPRDSSGNHSLPPGTIVSTGDTVLPSQHNPAMQDISQSLTGSLPRNGSGNMLANLPMNNNRIVNMADGVDPKDAATVGQLRGYGTPIGAVVDFWGDEVPENFMLAAGQTLSRSEYADLFAVIGTNAGAGDGVTTFQIPDYRAVTGVGRANMGGTLKGLLSNFAATTMGAIFGTQSHTLTEAQMPAHDHTMASAGAHSHTMTLSNRRGSNGNAGSSSGWDAGDIFIQSGISKSTNSAGSHTHTINNAGSSQAHPNVQPSIVCNKILRVR